MKIIEHIKQHGDLRFFLLLLLLCNLNAYFQFSMYSNEVDHLLAVVKPTPGLADRPLILIYVLSGALTLALAFFFAAALLRLVNGPAWSRVSLLTLIFGETVLITGVFVDNYVFKSIGIHAYSPIAIRTLLNPGFQQQIHFNFGQFFLLLGIFAGALIVQGIFYFPVSILVNRIHKRLQLIFGLGLVASVGFTAVGYRAAAVILEHDYQMAGNPVLKVLPLYDVLFEDVLADQLKVRYPDRTGRLKRPLNILILVAESIRSEAFHEKTAPRLTEFARGRGCSAFPHHFTGGHITELGLFSILYGVNSYNYIPFSREGTRSAFLSTLKQNQYRTIAYTSTNIRNWHNQEFVFNQFDEYNEFNLTNVYHQDDRVMTNRVLEFSRTHDRERPFFLFVYLNSTHTTYSYPPEFETFRPTIGEDFDVSKFKDADWEALRNRYRNSILYVDSLAGEILDAFRPDIASGELAVVFTADHGEEFGEHGVWGHMRSSPYDEQMRVPLIACIPQLSRPEGPTSHVDLAPTLLDLFGSEPRIEDLPFDGVSLLRPPRDRSLIVSGLGYPFFGDHLLLVTGNRKHEMRHIGPGFADVTYVRSLDLDDREIDHESGRNAYLAYENMVRETLLRFLVEESGEDRIQIRSPQPALADPR